MERAFKPFVGIAGSASDNDERALLGRCHRVVANLVNELLGRGYGIVTTVGEGKRLKADEPMSDCVFYWTILQEVASFAASDKNRPSFKKPLLRVVASQKAMDAIPKERASLWSELLNGELVELLPLNTTWNAHAYIRHHLAQAGDALVVLGGGEGVEHLASLYAERGRPVIPLDAPLSSFRGDGDGGAVRLNQKAMKNPELFVWARDEVARFPGELRMLSIKDEAAPLDRVAQKLSDFLDRLTVPRVVLICGHPSVDEPLIRDIVRPVLDGLHAQVRDPALDELHYADLVVGDIGGLDADGWIKLGHARGRGICCVLVGRERANHPRGLDVWVSEEGESTEQQRAKFREYLLKAWSRRELVVQRRELL